MRALLAITLLATLGACAAPTAPPPADVVAQVIDYGSNVAVLVSSKGNTALHITEEIVDYTDVAAMAALRDHPETKILVLADNQGGYVEEAQNIGRMARFRGMTTIVEGWCYSACVDIFVGGVNRRAGSGAEFGIHSPDIVNDENYELDRLYYNMMGVPQMLTAIYSIPYEDLYVFGPHEAILKGIAHNVF